MKELKNEITIIEKDKVEELYNILKDSKWFVIYMKEKYGGIKCFVEGREDFLNSQDAAMTILLQAAVKRTDESEYFERLE